MPRCNGGKHTYPTVNVAKRQAKEQTRRTRRNGHTGRKISAYHCPECDGWHLSGINPYKNKQIAS